MMRHKMRVVAILTFSLINGETAPSTPTNGGKCQQLPPTIIVDKIAEGYVRTAPEKTTPARSTPGTNLPSLERTNLVDLAVGGEDRR